MESGRANAGELGQESYFSGLFCFGRHIAELAKRSDAATYAVDGDKVAYRVTAHRHGIALDLPVDAMRIEAACSVFW